MLKKACRCTLPDGRGSVSAWKQVIAFLSRARKQALLALFSIPLIHRISAMLRNPFVRSGALRYDVDTLVSQRRAFTALNLFLLAALLILHVSFSSHWGKPSTALTAILASCFTLRALEGLLLRGLVIGPVQSAVLTWISICFNLFLAIVLASVIDREDSQYSALLIAPILEAAFRCKTATTLAVAAAADGILFYWVWRYFRLHPPAEIGEYFEAGTLSIIFLVVAALVSLMVRSMRRKGEQLASNICELERTRERLLQEEKLAAVGRLASAVAHEIRNPVAMISGSLSMANKLTGPQSEEMLDIATKEADRLVRLTNDLLAYARPRKPAPACGLLNDSVFYIADACRAHAQAKSVLLRVIAPREFVVEFDAAMLQQALMNLVMNAIDASPHGATVELIITEAGAEQIGIHVDNDGGPIGAEVATRLFEPFFTTKASGTGLGLATARALAEAQGGELIHAGNGARVRFTLLFARQQESVRTAGKG